jgi:hypothetical protein
MPIPGANLTKTDIGVTLEIKKLNTEKRLATGWVAVTADENGTPIIDADGHLIPTIELEKAVHEAFAETSGKGMGGDMHETRGVIDVVESFVFTAEKREALGLGAGPEGWVTTFRVNDDDLWSKVKNGKRPELSLKGEGMGVPI